MVLRSKFKCIFVCLIVATVVCDTIIDHGPCLEGNVFRYLSSLWTLYNFLLYCLASSATRLSGDDLLLIAAGGCLLGLIFAKRVDWIGSGREMSAGCLMENGSGQGGSLVSKMSGPCDTNAQEQETRKRRVDELRRQIEELKAEIEERKRVESALRDSEWKFRTLVENLNIGVFRNMVDSGKIVQTNTAMAKIFGYDSVQEFYKVSVTELYLDMVDRQKFLYEMKSKGFVKDRLMAMRKRDGTPIWCSVTAVAHYDNTGRMECSDGVLEDVTEQKLLEEQLRHSQKMEAIGTLTGGIAHDFNNMLTAILGYANLLKLKIPADSTLENYVEQILVSSKKAANLTKSLLAFSRKQLINPRPVNINEIVKGVEKLLIRLIGEDIEFTTKLCDGDLAVLADSGQMEQVLLNLVTNARDAMENGGMLAIETCQTTIRPYHTGFPHTLEPGIYAVISVSDTGGGMDKHMCQRIFEPFFTTKEIGRGTGLGLSIVYGIVRQHKGDIHVYSEPQCGTTFKMYLPIILNSTKKSDVNAASPLVGGTETILIAEDDDDVRNLMCSMLKQFGYTVIEAIDGRDAVEKFTRHQGCVDLLLLDVVMPGMNGKECLERIRKMNSRVPVIFSSGYTAEIIHAKGIREEGAGFLQKPVQPQELLAVIRQSFASK